MCNSVISPKASSQSADAGEHRDGGQEYPSVPAQCSGPQRRPAQSQRVDGPSAGHSGDRVLHRVMPKHICLHLFILPTNEEYDKLLEAVNTRNQAMVQAKNSLLNVARDSALE